MDKKTWQKHYAIHDVDMELIEQAVKENGKVSDIFNKPLDYKDIKIVFKDIKNLLDK